MIKNKDRDFLKKTRCAFAYHAYDLGIAAVKSHKGEGLKSMDKCETN